MLSTQLTVAESAVCAAKDNIARRARRDLDLLLRRAHTELKRQAVRAQKAAARNAAPGGKK
jgi:hypothetical protein